MRCSSSSSKDAIQSTKTKGRDWTGKCFYCSERSSERVATEVRCKKHSDNGIAEDVSVNMKNEVVFVNCPCTTDN